MDRDEQRALHEQYLSGHPTVAAVIFEKIIEPLVVVLARQYPEIPHDEIEDLVMASFLHYLEAPSSYDPHGRSLSNYFMMDVGGDLKNAFGSARRRHEVSIDALIEKSMNNHVELRLLARNNNQEDFTEQIVNDEYHRQLTSIVLEALPNPTDQAVLALLLQGVRDTGEYADILCITDLPVEERRSEVKRNLDRIKKVLRRLAPQVRMGFDGE